MGKVVVVAGIVAAAAAAAPSPSAAWTMQAETRDGALLCTSQTGRAAARHDMKEDQLARLECMRMVGGAALRVESEVWNGGGTVMQFTLGDGDRAVTVWARVSGVRITKL